MGRIPIDAHPTACGKALARDIARHDIVVISACYCSVSASQPPRIPLTLLRASITSAVSIGPGIE